MKSRDTYLKDFYVDRWIIIIHASKQNHLLYTIQQLGLCCAYAFSVFIMLHNVSMHVAHICAKIWFPTIRNWLATPLGKWSTNSWHENLLLNTIAQNFIISVETAHNILKCFILTGDIAAKAPCPRLGSVKLDTKITLAKRMGVAWMWNTA